VCVGWLVGSGFWLWNRLQDSRMRAGEGQFGGDICFRHLLIKFSSLLRNDCFMCPVLHSLLKLDVSWHAASKSSRFNLSACATRRIRFPAPAPVQEEVIRMKRFLVAVSAESSAQLYFSHSVIFILLRTCHT